MLNFILGCIIQDDLWSEFMTRWKVPRGQEEDSNRKGNDDGGGEKEEEAECQ